MHSMKGKRILITSSDAYMGPALIKKFQELGGEVLTSESKLLDQASVDTLATDVGEIDILVPNLAGNPWVASVEEITDEAWFGLCDGLLHALMRLLRAFLPQMKARQSGKVVAITSMSGLRTIPNLSSYSTMRAAQNALIRTAAVEAAPFNVQINAIAQNFVASETYFPEKLINDPDFLKKIRSVLPTGKIAPSEATADLAAFLASEANTHIIGHCVPFSGGWDIQSNMGFGSR